MKSIKIFLLILVALFLTSCGQHRVKTSPFGESSSYTFESSFISLEEVSPNIVMDVNTEVLYVREKHKVYGIGLYVYTTFPIMEADGTCLTFREWRSNHLGETSYVVNDN